MKFLIFISLVALGHCRPQDLNQKTKVETEKQTIIKIPSTNEQFRQLTHEEEQKRDANTKDILQKIAEVNLNHGFKPKSVKRNPFFPHQQQKQIQQSPDTKGKQLPNFQFSNTPFRNPIFDYLQRNENNYLTKQATNSENDEEVPEGYEIKRKVTHQQTLIIPNLPPMPDMYYNSNHMLASTPFQPHYDGVQNGQYGLVPINQIIPSIPDFKLANLKNASKLNKTMDELTADKQNSLINNIKNIIANSQYPSGYYNQINPYSYQVPQNGYQSYPAFPIDPQNNYRVNPYASTYHPYYMFIPPYNPYNPVQNQKFTDTFFANLQTEKDTETGKLFYVNTKQSPEIQSRQISPPFSEYFPIVIKNPFQQMFQAFTSMIEYGPSANLCRQNNENNKHILKSNKPLSEENLKTAKSLQFQSNFPSTNKPSFELKDEDTNTEIVIKRIEETTASTSDNDFYIEGLKIVGDKKQGNTMKRSQNNKSDAENRQMEEFPDEEVILEEDKLFNPQRYPQKEEIPGNGIFIQKLKVRKGGVAIAGPGGIATAGSGGTAVVGPNGFAYTQPNGVAIAGPGSRVISVDPSVNLSEFVQNVIKNGTMSRLGRLVAIGPVVYHDLGQSKNENTNIITYVPFYGGAKGLILQIIEAPDGTITTEIIRNNEVSNELNTTESMFNKEIKLVHQTADNIIKIQELAKANGNLNAKEQDEYNENLEQLNLATRNLAQFQQEQIDEENDDNISRSNLKFWFEQKKNKFLGKQSEENKEEEQNQTTDGNGNGEDGIIVNLPPEDASVAEAKPVGLAVAGKGGVAASKPIATAVVGPGGLAVARPVATAIAGVSPDEAIIPIYADGSFKFPDKKKNKHSNKEPDKLELCDKTEKCEKEDSNNKEEKPKQDYFSGSEYRYD